ncbi:retropepsin-like aspartic protease family protein [Limimaricola cinnabarinus]|jgi:aspartyl protease family protein|uniref:TIGR02281 family clan AA aspartic protease n=1 Tax=Limimaricola cinnabarinus TaxID=1125964 RepID=A0A2G1MLF6_9RHOB|nr:TIGR02281 family clan AA aspartic protease [Limimaricola cinnabarinus]PHP29565.1 TIGR02281 family clan AA aspartic protease [Limimaricola cinnabarinus]
MSPDNLASLAYLGLLGAAIAGWFVVQNRDRLGQLAQQAALWALIFIGVIAAAGLWGDIRDDVTPRQTMVGAQGIEVPQARDGHYYLTLDINGTPVEFVVDTGATDMVLSREDARRAGIDPEALNYFGSAVTANGTVRTARVTLDSVALGQIEDEGLGAVVTDGDLSASLLGMGYLRLFGRIEIEGGKLMLTR